MNRVALVLCAFVSFVLGKVPAPRNLTLQTENTQYLLIWDWDRNYTDRPVTFSAEYIAAHKLRRNHTWTSVCNGTSDTSCDFTGCHLLYQGMFVLRVRASVDGHPSVWVRKNFCPDEDAALGPPSRVELAPAGNLLDVSISTALASNGVPMSDLIGTEYYYRIQYWSCSDDPQCLRPEVINTSNTLVTLPGLDSRTWYCVSVQARYDLYNKGSRYTAPVCMMTDGDVQPWKIVLYFLVALVVCCLLVLLLFYIVFRFHLVIKNTFYPSNQLPCHIQEYLDYTTGSDLPRLLTPDTELCCDRLSVCPEVVLLEIHLPAPLMESDEDSGRHIRQDSGDSGVYSTEGGSAQQSSCSSTGSGPLREEQEVDSCQMAEQMKMEEMGTRLVLDEGVGNLFGLF
ncbi:hypothetical protein DPEC_G00137850 [Dallia pectoralis]|uniref:Uncharacterized protein n=1 Tax=Dallia pectoralis TaxID=75939 RepID=A0ACC2GLH2_DALPE|nr:hypothetical protein DPEC_G00137850 [Dallia pectoralis]